MIDVGRKCKECGRKWRKGDVVVVIEFGVVDDMPTRHAPWAGAVPISAEVRHAVCLRHGRMPAPKGKRP